MKADLADFERLKGGHLGGALVATALMGPSLIPLMRVGFLWLLLIPPILWGVFTGYLWRRYIRLSGQAARLRVEIEESEAPSPNVSAVGGRVRDSGPA